MTHNVLMLIIVVVGKEEVGFGGDGSSLTPLTDSQGRGDDEQPPVSLKKKIKQFRQKLQCVRHFFNLGAHSVKPCMAALFTPYIVSLPRGVKLFFS